MAEPPTQKKNKKAKKKSETNEIPAVISAKSTVNNSVSLNSASTKNLPQELAAKISEDAKVAVTNDKDVTNESVSKKKKKSKKKSKEVLKETFVENNNSEPLLNFSENGIQLVNHPEISVTITDSSQTKDNEVKSVADKAPFTEEKQNNNSVATSVASDTAATTASTNTAKKKKKKKKKGSSDSVPAASTTSNENTIVTPTYTKVVTSDNTCVLVVNNEKFSVDAKPLENSENKSKVPDNSINFSLSSEKELGNVLLTKSFTPDTNVQFSNSVSIFPVLTNGNSNTPEPQKGTIINLEPSSNAETKMNETIEKENTEESKPTKSQLKAERRAKQEAQRAAKLAKNNTKVDANANSMNESKNTSSKEKPKDSGTKTVEVTNEIISVKLPVEKESLHKVKLFSHLPQCKQFDSKAKLHPAILEVGFQYNKGIICGSNARCIALLEAFMEVIKDYTPLPDRNFCRDLEASIQSYLNFLDNCRPLSFGMMNAIKFLKHEINQIPSDMKADKIKERLCDFISNFVKADIVLAKEAIAKHLSCKIHDGDVIMILGFSSVVRDVLCKAHNRGIMFRVVVVDSRPRMEGLKMLRSLVKQGLRCSYILINAVSYIMKEVTKVIIGAHAMLANGSVMSRLGNKQIALVASTYGVSVYVCCETYKLCERLLTDSFVHNELGEPTDIIDNSHVLNDGLKNSQNLPLQPLNLLYDVTTPNLISEIITEKAKVPCTSVPVLLRKRFAKLAN